MLIVLAGPEKAGKTTLASLLQERHHAEVHHWGPVKADSDFLPVLKQHAGSPRLVIWDRGWPCDCVYSMLLQRDRRAQHDWWLLEWLYGRALQTVGVGCIMLGPGADRLRELRDDTDLPVDPRRERFAYRAYGTRFGWQVVENAHSTNDAVSLCDELAHRAERAQIGWLGRSLPPTYCGPQKPEIVFVGQGRNMQSNYPGSWLPFTTRYTERYGRVLGDLAFRWTNMDGPTDVVDQARLVVACGNQAADWARAATSWKKVMHVPHPAWLYRWGQAEGQIQEVERRIQAEVQRVLEPGKERNLESGNKVAAG
jgi:hypothetical protein